MEAAIITTIQSLEGISSAPDSKRQDHHHGPSNLCPGGSPDVREVQRKSEHSSSENLRQPIQRVVQCASPHIEARKVDVVELVCIEPVRREEHWKKENDIWICTESLPKTQDLRLPCWVLHHDNSGTIAAYDVLGIDKCPRKACADERQNHETDICAIRNGCCSGSILGVEVEGQLHLQPSQSPFLTGITETRLTRPPITAPILKIIQNQEMYLPFSFSGG